MARNSGWKHWHFENFGKHCHRKVIFCRSIDMACTLYEYYEDGLGDCAYSNPQSGPAPSNRIFAMYHSESASSVKTAVSDSLLDPNEVVRRVFATRSLGMGIDCPNIREVTHWGSMFSAILPSRKWKSRKRWLASKSYSIACCPLTHWGALQ